MPSTRVTMPWRMTRHAARVPKKIDWVRTRTRRARSAGASGLPRRLASRSPTAPGLLADSEASLAGGEFGEGLIAAHPVLHLHPLALVEVLVDGEEVTDPVERGLGPVADVGRGPPLRVVGRDTQELGVLALLVGHDAHAEDLGLDETPRERRVRGEDQDVEGVTVPAQRVGDEAVLGGVPHGHDEVPVELDRVTQVVVLVLVMAVARDLDDDVDGVHGSPHFAGRALRGATRSMVARVTAAPSPTRGADAGAPAARAYTSLGPLRPRTRRAAWSGSRSRSRARSPAARSPRPRPTSPERTCSTT